MFPKKKILMNKGVKNVTMGKNIVGGGGRGEGQLHNHAFTLLNKGS